MCACSANEDKIFAYAFAEYCIILQAEAKEYVNGCAHTQNATNML